LAKATHATLHVSRGDRVERAVTEDRDEPSHFVLGGALCSVNRGRPRKVVRRVLPERYPPSLMVLLGLRSLASLAALDGGAPRRVLMHALPPCA
jgi:hypothetical protein